MKRRVGLTGSRKDARYILLTTFRADGSPVPTPVWFVARDGVLYVWTGARAGKLKRIRATAAVTVAPCTMRGRPVGPTVEARAEIIASTGLASEVERLLARKYWAARPALRAYNRVARLVRHRPPGQAAFIAVTLNPGQPVHEPPGHTST